MIATCAIYPRQSDQRIAPNNGHFCMRKENSTPVTLIHHVALLRDALLRHLVWREGIRQA